MSFSQAALRYMLPGQLDVHGHVGQLELDGLELADGLAELHALLGVLEGGVQAGLSDAHAHGPDGDAAAVEHHRNCLKPSPRSPTRFFSGTRTSSKESSVVLEPCRPIFS